MFITKIHQFKYIEHFTTEKGNCQIKFSDIFHIPAQNIDCRNSLEPAVLTSNLNLCFFFLFVCLFSFYQNTKNKVYPYCINAYCIKVRFKRVKIK